MHNENVFVYSLPVRSYGRRPTCNQAMEMVPVVPSNTDLTDYLQIKQ